MALPRHDDWMKLGACRGQDTELFFTDANEPPAEVVKICDHCPVKEVCLTWALERKQVGIWGGLTDFQRRQLLRKKSRVHCPGCESVEIHVGDRYEACVSCGLTWFA